MHGVVKGRPEFGIERSDAQRTLRWILLLHLVWGDIDDDDHDESRILD